MKNEHEQYIKEINTYAILFICAVIIISILVFPSYNEVYTEKVGRPVNFFKEINEDIRLKWFYNDLYNSTIYSGVLIKRE